jgi:hypothetical protein
VKEKVSEDNTGSLNLRSQEKANLFFIIVSVILSIFGIFLGYSLLNKTGIFVPDKQDLEKPKNVQQLIQVEVLNGCGVAGVGDQLTDVIRSKGIDVVKTGNFISFDIDKTFIIDRMDRIETAYRVADSLGISKKMVVKQINKQYILDMTIVIGKDYKKYFNKSEG